MRNQSTRADRRTRLAAMTRAVLLVAVGALLWGGSALAQTKPYVEVASRHGYKTTVQKINAAIQAAPVAPVTRASATMGAKSLGITIPGNMVIGLFAPKFAVRMLKASVDAGFEAPVRLYIVEHPGGKVVVRYRKPSVVFAPYGSADLDAMASELDAIFARIAGAVR